MTAPPPSTISCSTPRDPSSSNTSSRRTPPPRPAPTTHTSTPASDQRESASAGAAAVVKTSVGAAAVSRRGPLASRPRASSTTRTGGFGGAAQPGGRSPSPSSRSVRRGSSTTAVPDPTRIAWEDARRSCACLLALGPVIHCEVPSSQPIAPSSVLATLRTTYGALQRRWWRYGRSEASTAFAPVPTVTQIPFSRRCAAPPPKAGSGSRTAMWISRSPLATSASSHGGVVLPGPRWHGSSVT
mmetsp:Transcript_14108/g.47053  ORF Transcript_14108/g.47053 Transcript_14108/m.47053 type:complete len:242 (+) Transcript_14108:395-1120(+)